MNFSRIKLCDIANGPGVRTSLFVSGCRHHCHGCFNEEAWSFDAGDTFGHTAEEQILNSLRPYYITGLSLLGGEPMEPENQAALLPFLQRLRREMPDKSIWCYSGFTWEELTGSEPSRARCEATDALLALINVVVDGPYVKAKHDISLRFRGSSNQRILDVQASLKTGMPVLWVDEKVYSTHTMD